MQIRAIKKITIKPQGSISLMGQIQKRKGG